MSEVQEQLISMDTKQMQNKLTSVFIHSKVNRCLPVSALKIMLTL